MSSEEINRAIAEHLGWRESPLPIGGAAFNRWWSPSGKYCEGVPDYYNNLNAIHGAVRSLLFSQRKKYREHLQAILSRGLTRGIIGIEECIDADSPQRAEAFLRTIGKWQESPKP